MSLELNLLEKKHPDPKADHQYHRLIGIDEQKENLLGYLELILNNKKLDSWKKSTTHKGFHSLKI